MITSDSFFLHEHGYVDPMAELNATIELLNSENGNVIACNYPARYLWIKSQGFDVGSFDLESCQELNEYISSFQKDSLSLVFASEHIDSPASAFGHILLVFHDDDKPLLTADTINFTAETPNDNFFKYAYKGLTGDYDSYFFRTPFFIIKNSYTVVEQRDLYFYKLDLSRDQLKFLIYHLYELRKAKYKYYFITENCAYQIASLLEVAYGGAGNGDHRNSISVLPMDILNSYKDKIVSQFTIEATIKRAQRLFEQMSPDDKQAYSFVKKGTLQINNDLPDKVKETLAIGYEYKFRRFRKILPDYDEAVRLKFSNLLPPPSVRDTASNNSKNMFGIGVYKDRYSQGVYLQYRLIGRDLFENQLNKLQESHLTFLDTELTISDNETVRLQRLDFIRAKSLFSRSKIASATSWSINFGINRQNTLNDAVLDLSLGLGRGYSGYSIGISYLIEAGLQDNESEGNIYLKPSVDLIYYPTNSLKIGLAALKKYGEDGRYDESAVFISKDFDRLSILAKYVMPDSIYGDYSMLVLRRHF